MQNIYEETFTMHKAFVHLHGLQQQCKDFVKTLRNVKTAMVVMHERIIRYKWTPLDLGKKIKPEEELENAKV